MRDHGTHTLCYPRVRHAHDPALRQERIRNTVPNMCGVRRQLHVVFRIRAISVHCGPALDVLRAEEETPGGEGGCAGFVDEAVVENVQGEGAAEFGGVAVAVEDGDVPADAVGDLDGLYAPDNEGMGQLVGIYHGIGRDVPTSSECVGVA